MKQSLDLKSIANNLSRWFARFHTIIFFLIIGLSLIFCIYTLLSVLNESGLVDQASATHVDTNFDTQTIQRVEELKGSNSDAPFAFPDGRTNPFVE